MRPATASTPAASTTTRMGLEPPGCPPGVITRFNARTTCTVNSYSRLQWNGTYIDGRKTLGENMAGQH